MNNQYLTYRDAISLKQESWDTITNKSITFMMYLSTEQAWNLLNIYSTNNYLSSASKT